MKKTNTSLDDLLTFFAPYDVIHVNRRTYVDNKSKDNARHFKGSVFVTFKDKASADTFMALESVKNPEGEALIRKWQAEYFKEKEKEYEEKKAKNSAERKAKSKVVEEQAKKDEETEENRLPKGAVIFMKGFEKTTMREDIKEVLKEKFSVEMDSIAFVDYEKGQESGYVRFTEENAAIELGKKMKEVLGEEKLKVKDAEIEHKVLEGEEETEYLDKALAQMKSRKDKNRGHKRRHGGRGGGGRGGKRFRND